MSHHPTRLDAGETVSAIRSRIAAAIPDAQMDVAGSGGHFTIAVTSTVFAGKTTLARQRLVYSAIRDLMDGGDAPVHAVDSLVTREPG
jgi:acid stress-induced BolA-like protein IbaG/YrbA